MFIRTKKIKNQLYAYLVKNTWKKRKKSSRQKTHSYLGKVIKPQKTQNKTFQEFINYNFEEAPIKKLIKDLIKLELYNHNFKQVSKNKYEYENIIVNLKDKKVTKGKKEICLEINNNFLCSYTLRKLIDFSPKKDLTQLQIGKQLANSFESAGIILPKEIFVIVAKKVLKEIEK